MHHSKSCKFSFLRGVMRLFLHFLHAKTHPNFWEQCSKHLSGTLLSSDQLTLAQRQWSGGRLLFSGLIVWEELACSKEAGRMFVWKEAGRILVWQVCVCAGFTPSAEAAQHSGMLLACTQGITGQGEGFYPINTADHMEPPLLSTTF